MSRTVLVPDKPVVSSTPYTSTSTTITIQASGAGPAVSAASGSLDKYKLSSTGTGSTANPDTANNADMEITGLDGGQVYTLTFKAIKTCSAGSPTTSTVDSDDYKACTC